MSKLYAVSLDLTPASIKKLTEGKTVHIPHTKLLKGIQVVLKKKKVSRVVRAAEKQRGVRLQMDPEELEMQGGAFWDVLKNIGSFIRDKVFTNQVYKQNIAPLIKQGLNSGVDALTAAAAAEVPMLAPVVNTLGKAAVSKVGEVSGAYGLRRGRKGIGYGMSDYTPGGPLNPALPLQDFSKPDYSLVRPRLVKGSKEAMEWGAKMRQMKMMKRASEGGSFLPAGY